MLQIKPVITSKDYKAHDISFISNRLLQAEGVEIFSDIYLDKIVDPKMQSMWAFSGESAIGIPPKIYNFLNSTKVSLNTERFYDKIRANNSHQQRRVTGDNLFSIVPTEILVEIFSYLPRHVLPLLMTVCKDFYYCISELMRHSRVFGYRDAFDTTSLHMAIWHEDPGLSLLIATKCPDFINTTDGFNDTPLHIAMRVANPALVRLLLELGADPLKENIYCVSPFNLALEWKNEKVIEFLYVRNYIQLKSLGKLTLERMQRLEAAKVKFIKKNKLLKFPPINIFIVMYCNSCTLFNVNTC